MEKEKKTKTYLGFYILFFFLLSALWLHDVIVTNHFTFLIFGVNSFFLEIIFLSLSLFYHCSFLGQFDCFSLYLSDGFT